ncbi:MAG: FeoB-associated Cys-rich membrane protein [Eubacteriales bacterium]|nr:FeoB-associated Cys-rich membrane protein [Eubacteriales bacterium]
MSLADIILGLLILIACILVFRYVRKTQAGGGCVGCSACGGGCGCSGSCKPQVKKKHK